MNSDSYFDDSYSNSFYNYYLHNYNETSNPFLLDSFESQKIKKCIQLFVNIDHSLFSTLSSFPTQQVQSLLHLLFDSFIIKDIEKNYIQYYDQLSDRVFNPSNEATKEEIEEDLDSYIELILQNKNEYCYWKKKYNSLSQDMIFNIYTFIQFVCYQRCISTKNIGKGFMKHSHLFLIELLKLNHGFSFLLFQVILCEFLGLYQYSEETGKYLLDELELSNQYVDLREWNRLYYQPIAKNGIGSWKDLKYLASMIQNHNKLSNHTKQQAIEFIVELYVKMIERDWHLNINEMSLCVKWIPRECSSPKFNFLYPYIVYYEKYDCHLNEERKREWKSKNKDCKKFREKISYLNTVLGTLETKMTNDEFYGIYVNDLTSIQRITHINALRNVNSNGCIRDKTRNVDGRKKCSHYFHNVTRNEFDNVCDIGNIMKMITMILYKLERRNVLRSDISDMANKKDECWNGWEKTSLDMIERNRQISEIDKQIELMDKQWFSILKTFTQREEKNFIMIDFIERKGNFGFYLIRSIASALITIFSSKEENVCLGVLNNTLQMFSFSKKDYLSDILQKLGNVDIFKENDICNDMLMNISKDIKTSFYDCEVKELYVLLYTMYPELYDEWIFNKKDEKNGLYFTMISMKRSDKHMSVSYLSPSTNLSCLKKKTKKRTRNNKNWKCKGLVSNTNEKNIILEERYKNARWNYLYCVLEQFYKV